MDKSDKLRQEISIEQAFIEKTLALLDEALNRSEKSGNELSAIGSFLHHCYTGMENILTRILKFRKIKISSSASSQQRFIECCSREENHDPRPIRSAR